MAVNSVRYAADPKDIHLQIVVNSAVGLVSGSGGRLQQVVWNLRSNAIKLTPKGRRIRLDVARRLERRDHGERYETWDCPPTCFRTSSRPPACCRAGEELPGGNP